MSESVIKSKLKFHGGLSISLYLVFAFCDSWLTLKGMGGDLLLEGNPVMRYFMEQFGLVGGLVVGKGLVLTIAVALAIPTTIGIHHRSEWVYYLAITPIGKRWMRRKPRYLVAFLTVYAVALSQIVATLSWLYLILAYGSL